jgi:hypothetical protein
LKLVREHINEKFEDNSDPIADMGIGLKVLIDKWMEKYNQYKNPHYTLNNDGTINIQSFLYNHDVDIIEFPDYINFNRAGYFDCSFRTLTSLRGCPKYVSGEFSCVRANLTSLIGGPEYAAKYFVYNNKNLTSLEGLKIIKNFFSCDNTPITETEIERILNKPKVNINKIYYAEHKYFLGIENNLSTIFKSKKGIK